MINMDRIAQPLTNDEAIVELLVSYHELNAGHIDELEEAPTPLIFMHYVVKNHPFVIRGAATDWPATSLWSPEYLSRKLGNNTVKVAVTPSGSGMKNLSCQAWILIAELVEMRTVL